MHKPHAYIASPLGFSEATRSFYYGTFIPLIRKCGFTIIDPWSSVDPRRIKAVKAMKLGEAQQRRWQELNHLMGRTNADGILRACVICAVLDGPDVDSGTAAEIGFGAAYGRPVLGYREDFRLASENIGARVNLQVEYFVTMHGGEIVDNLETYEMLLQKWKRRLGTH